MMMMNNSEFVLEFKEMLNKQFHSMRKALTQITIRQNNEEWQQLRASGKATRKKETDTLMEFVEYATKNGSRNAAMYFANISKMENKALFFLEQKFDNVREILAGQQLAVINSADQIVEKSLKEGMAHGLDYHAIYQIAKENVETFASIIGKTPVPMIDIKELEG
jgi:L-lactate utilization protein LutB